MNYKEKRENRKAEALKATTESFEGIFKEIPENPGYFATSNGNIYSYRSRKFLKLTNHNLGYLFAGRFTIGGKNRLRLAHSLIAYAFHGKCPDGYEINHINGIKTDNRPENLEYVTRQENMQAAWKSGLMEKSRNAFKGQVGDKNPKAKLTEANVKEIIDLKMNHNKRTIELANMFGVEKKAIYSIFNGRTWGHMSGFKKSA